MEKSILKSLFKGEVIPGESKFVQNEKSKELSAKIRSDRTYFEANMSQDEKSRFDQYHCLISERNCIESYDEQVYAFSVGLLMGLEVMEKKGDMINE